MELALLCFDKQLVLQDMLKDPVKMVGVVLCSPGKNFNVIKVNTN